MNSSGNEGAELRRGRRGAPRWLAGGALLCSAALVTWFGLGMHRGVLLSLNIRAKVWPWAPFVAEQPLRSQELSDPVWQFVPWLEFARRELAAGRLPLWNPHQDGGVPLLANAQSALGSPLLWPALALGAGRGWNFSLLARVLAAGIAAWVWLRGLGRSYPAAALGASMFAGSGPLLGWLQHPHSLTVAFAPLVLHYGGRLAAGSSCRDAIGLAAATGAVLVGGHPETALQVALMAVVWTAVQATTPAGAGRAVGGALVGTLLAAPVLVPFAEYLANSVAVTGVGRFAFVLPWGALYRLIAPHAEVGHPIEAAATVSVVGLALAVIGLGAARKRREVWFAVVCVGVILVATYDNPGSRWLSAHTPVLWTRLLLLLPLPLALLATASVERLLSWRVRDVGVGGPLAWALAVTVGAELVSGGRGIHVASDPRELALATPIVEILRADREIFRILPLHTFLPADSATLLELDDVRGFDSMTPRAWRESRAAMGRFTGLRNVVDVVEPWDLAPGGAALDAWNVKYLLVHPQLDWNAETLNRDFGLDVEEVYSGPDGRLLRNRRVLPRVRLDGDGEVVGIERTPTRWRMEVAAAGPATLVLANPHFPGWSATLDDRPVAERPAVGAPWRVAVPAGRHVVEVRYRPASFRVGLVLAGLAAVSLASWTWRDVRRGVAEARAPSRR